MSFARSRAGYLLGVVITVLGGLAFLLMAILIGAAILEGEAKGPLAAAVMGGFLLVSAIPLAGGVLLLRRADPELGVRLLARFREFRAAALTPGGMRGFLFSAIGMALAFYLISLVLVLVNHATGTLVSFLLICAYGFTQPIRNLQRPRWWRNTAVSFAAFFALLLGVAALTDLKNGDSMVYLAPFMYYPAWLGVTGIIRLVSWLGARTPKGPPDAAGAADAPAQGQRTP